jgi:hypothetical protein
VQSVRVCATLQVFTECIVLTLRPLRIKVSPAPTSCGAVISEVSASLIVIAVSA